MNILMNIRSFYRNRKNGNNPKLIIKIIFHSEKKIILNIFSFMKFFLLFLNFPNFNFL